MGKVIKLHAKAKGPEGLGLPKQLVQTATVTKEGLQGDYNYYRTEHLDSTPDQALLIITMDKIQELNNEGWMIKPGDIGENLTIEGMAYDEFEPGSIFRVGEVEFQISYACDPCKNLYHLSYVGETKGPEFVKTMMHRRGWYARVLKEGRITIGVELTKL